MGVLSARTVPRRGSVRLAGESREGRAGPLHPATTDLPPVPLCDLRHSSATRTQGGGDIHAMEEMLRHSTITPALDVVSFGESAVADEGAGDGGEGEEVFGLAFVAAVQAAAAGQPGHGAF